MLKGRRVDDGEGRACMAGTLCCRRGSLGGSPSITGVVAAEPASGRWSPAPARSRLVRSQRPAINRHSDLRNPASRCKAVELRSDTVQPRALMDEMTGFSRVWPASKFDLVTKQLYLTDCVSHTILTRHSAEELRKRSASTQKWRLSRRVGPPSEGAGKDGSGSCARATSTGAQSSPGVGIRVGDGVISVEICLIELPELPRPGHAPHDVPHPEVAPTVTSLGHTWAHGFSAC